MLILLTLFVLLFTNPSPIQAATPTCASFNGQCLDSCYQPGCGLAAPVGGWPDCQKKCCDVTTPSCKPKSPPPPPFTCNNYCAPSAVECDPGTTFGTGGTCPSPSKCCGKNPSTPTPTPTSPTPPPPTPPPTPIPTSDPRNFKKNIPCDENEFDEFNPLRPYPGSPCDPLIPKSLPEKEYISFACGKSLTPVRDVLYSSRDPRCSDNPDQVCKQLDFDITINLADTKIPVLGNTEDPNLTDSAKINEYLLSYLTGPVQVSDQIPLNPQDPKDTDRLVNFSGPLKKLLPYSSQQELRRNLATDSASVDVNIHNYTVGCDQVISLDPRDYKDFIIGILQAIGSLGFDAGTFVGKTLGYLGDQFNRLPILGRAILTAAVEYKFNGKDAARAAAQNVLATSTNSKGDPAGNVDLGMEPIDFLLDQSGNVLEMLQDVGMIYSSFRPIAPNQAVSCSQSTFFDIKAKLKGDSWPWPFDKGGIYDHLPPNPNDYDKYNDYQTALLKWYGYWFIGPFPIAPIAPNVWAQLFQNVPFSTLEDTTSEVTISIIPDKQPDSIIKGDPSRPITLTIAPYNPYSKTPDARIYVPHVRAIDALSSALQDLVAPQKSSPSPPNYLGIIPKHQGEDGIPVINNTDNNSSVIPGAPAPAPLFTPHDPTCDLKDVRFNPGDSLLGNTITAHLTYTQRFPAPPLPPVGACYFKSTPTCDPNFDCGDSTCCTDQAYCAQNLTGKSEGQVAVFTKTPLIDGIYDKLVNGTQSVYKRFLYRLWDYNIELKDIPVVSAVGYSSNASYTKAGDGSGGPEIYFPRLGSIYDYFLKGIQEALRPQGVGISQPPATLAKCNYSKDEIDSAISQAAANVPESQLRAIYNIENFGYHPGDKYTCSNNSKGAAGPFQITGGAYDDVTCPQEKVTQDSCTQYPGKLSRCNIADAAELASRVLLYKVGKWDTNTCKPKGKIETSPIKDVYNSSYGYYGSFNPDSATEARAKDPPALPLRNDSKNRNYSDVVCGRMGLCPPYPPQQWQ